MSRIGLMIKNLGRQHGNDEGLGITTPADLSAEQVLSSCKLGRQSGKLWLGGVIHRTTPSVEACLRKEHDQGITVASG